MARKLFVIGILGLVIGLGSCSKKSTPAPDANSTFPQILSLTADHDSIKVGGTEPAVLTCMAQGGNLTYTWEVDLGDLFPLNETGSVMQFTGSECCIGEKYIKCTVSNDKGSIMDTVIVYIFIP